MELIAEFKECPDCKVDARLMNSIVQEEIAKGNIEEGSPAATDGRVITNINILTPPLVGGRLAGARVFYDICTKCGTEYIVRIEKGHVTLPTRPGMLPTFA